MRSKFNVSVAIRAIGRASLSTERWSRGRYFKHRSRLIRELKLFDTTGFGRIRGAGALSVLGQRRVGWWHEVIAEAKDRKASLVIVEVEGISHLLKMLNAPSADIDDHPLRTRSKKPAPPPDDLDQRLR